jgi:DNA-binding transcriptional regulator/RsmH inhibitor MraZ
VGADNRIEIWAADAWETYLSRHEVEFAELDQDGGVVLP